jgi:flagellar biosynthetic protein FliR
MVFFFSPVSAAVQGPLPTSGSVLLTLFFKEVLFAVLFGFAAGMVFYGIQAAGNIVDNQRQLANAQIFNPGIGAQSSLFGIFFYQLAIVIFLLIGGHRLLLEALGRSFDAVPVLGFPKIREGIPQLVDLMMHLGADTLVIALQLGAPVLVAIFIADLILGLTNRVAPMVNVFEMGFNIKGFVGVLLVYLSLPLIILQMKTWFSHYLDSLRRIIEIFIK